MHQNQPLVQCIAYVEQEDRYLLKKVWPKKKRENPTKETSLELFLAAAQAGQEIVVHLKVHFCGLNNAKKGDMMH